MIRKSLLRFSFGSAAWSRPWTGAEVTNRKDDDACADLPLCAWSRCLPWPRGALSRRRSCSRPRAAHHRCAGTGRRACPTKLAAPTAPGVWLPPNPDATCCEDHIHCCPLDYPICDINTGSCRDSDGKTVAVLKKFGLSQSRHFHRLGSGSNSVRSGFQRFAGFVRVFPCMLHMHHITSLRRCVCTKYWSGGITKKNKILTVCILFPLTYIYILVTKICAYNIRRTV